MTEPSAQSGSFALTPMQQGMLFHALRDGNDGSEILQIVGRLHEALDVERLFRAWRVLEEKHETLRLRVRWQDLGAPVQGAVAGAEAPLYFLDWRAQAAFEHDRTLAAFIQADRVAGFDIASAPLNRITVIQLADEEFVLIWTHHHIFIDGRSQLIILEELFAYYDSDDEPAGSAEAARPSFSAHVAWFAQQDQVTAREFWSEALSGFEATPALPLPCSHSDERGVGMLEEQERILSQENSDLVRTLVRDNGLSTASLFESFWGLLMARHAGRDDIAIGVTRAGRYSGIDGAEDIVGNLINTLPFRIRVNDKDTVAGWLKKGRARLLAQRPHEHASLMEIQALVPHAPGGGLFDSLVICDSYRIQEELHRRGGPWLKRDFALLDQTPFALNLYVYDEEKIVLKIAYDNSAYTAADVRTFLDQLVNLAVNAARQPSANIEALSMMAEKDEEAVLAAARASARSYDKGETIIGLINRQIAGTPSRTALVFEDQELTFAELGRRSAALACSLMHQGVKAGDRVGLCIDRSLEMVIGLLGIMKSGAAYVPLDPAFPHDRLRFMVSDSGIDIIVGDNATAGLWEKSPCHFHVIDAVKTSDCPDAAETEVRTSGDSVAYVLYTSGSTGRPKGVEVTHRNVVNFFTGMDENIDHDDDSVWLAVTSISFDISVLELFWTLARGLKVVVLGEKFQGATQSSADPLSLSRPLSFSLFFFGGAQEGDEDSYRLLLDAARFADDNGLVAVWTPERHFDAFGGIFPNPSVTGAAVAAVTKNIDVRAGSVVIPLQDPLRVAEEWAVVDNLSHGRCGIALASGWHARDFALQPQNYEGRHASLFDSIKTLRHLWRGGSIERPIGSGGTASVRVHPRPHRGEIPLWITSGGNKDTMESAGAHGASLLTHLLGQNLDDLQQKIASYRRAFAAQSADGEDGHVTMMLHTFLDKDLDEARRKVKRPLIDYLKTSSNLVMSLARSLGNDDAPGVSEMDDFLESRFERYVGDMGLLGSPESCWPMVQKMADLGVDELACFIDFGLPYEAVMKSLQLIAGLAERCRNSLNRKHQDFGPAAMIKRHGVTHLQCTPSLMGIWLADHDVSRSLASVEHILIGGEAFPEKLATDLQRATRARVTNMYGPTETTIWSSCFHLEPAHNGPVPIGDPIANTQLFVLDQNQRLLPVGVPGELYIGGDGLARGYLGRPELTKERFVTVEWPGEEPRRLYRTGDRVRYRDARTLEFLGRVDSQVKIRGHRIEPGEVETEARSFEGIDEVVVSALPQEGGEHELALWYTTRKAVTPESLRVHLKSRLPDVMMPTFLMPLEAFPLTPNKKIDRLNLPHPSLSEPVLAADSRLPSPGSEEELAAIWRRVLSRDAIGAGDNFFDVGGHSLSAIRLLSEVGEDLGVAVTLAQLFDNPTLEGLAAFIDREKLQRSDAGLAARILSELESRQASGIDSGE